MYSPEQQIMRCEQYAKQHNIQIVDIVRDLNLSGRTFEKRKVIEIIERIQNGEAEIVLVWKYSRFGRSKLKNAVHIVLVEKAGGQVISATEGGNEKTNVGRLNRNIIMSVDEFYSGVMGDTWKDTHERRRNSGLPHTGKPRLGYMRCPKCERDEENPTKYKPCECGGVFVPDPERAWAVKEVYTRFTEGEGLRKVIADVASRGVTTTVDGAPLTWGHWTTALDSGFAAGWLRAKSEEAKEENPNGRRIDDYDVWVKGKHDALISEEIWQKYRKRRMARERLPPKAREPKHSLSGFIRCGGRNSDGELCLRVMTAARGGRKGEKYVVFRCPVHADTGACTGSSIGLITTEKIVRRWIRDNAKDDGRRQRALDEMLTSEQNAGELRHARARVAQLDEKRTKLASGWASGLLKDDLYRTLSEELDVELDVAHATVAKLERATTRIELGPEVFLPIAEQWDGLPPAAKNEALQHVVDHIISIPMPGRARTMARVVGLGEAYDYALPSRGVSRVRARRNASLAKTHQNASQSGVTPGEE